jgi:hypothetical protein
MRLRWRGQFEAVTSKSSSCSGPDRISEMWWYFVVFQYHDALLIEGTISGLFRFHQAFNEDLNPNLLVPSDKYGTDAC